MEKNGSNVLHKTKKIEEEKPTLRPLAFSLYQEVLLTMLSRRRQGLVLDHCKNEHEEKTVLGLHDASDQPLLPDHPFQLANDDFQLLFKFDPPSLLYGSIKSKYSQQIGHLNVRSKINQMHSYISLD